MESPIFKYLDYRLYLQDLYHVLKQEKSYFSLRYFSKAAGFSSPNYLKLVMDGDRNLSHKSVRKFCKALKLTKDEAEFFENLVFMNQSQTTEEKNYFYSKLAKNKSYLAIKGLEKDQYEYFTQWYYAVIREMVLWPEFRADPQWIADHLLPKITTKEASEAIDLLLRLGLLKRSEAGRFIQSDRSISSGETVKSLALSNFHRTMMQRAQEAIDTNNREEREISAITIAMDARKMGLIKEKVKEFRKEIHDLLAEETAPDAVYQINFQCFRLL